MEKVLLHICCGVCAGYPVESLRQEGFQVTGFFYNPNIGPKEEYLMRLESAEKAAVLFDYKLIKGDYDFDAWMKDIAGYEDEPEGGKRCSFCFKKRLKETGKKAQELSFDYFATTLSVSPHKDAKAINDIGSSLGQERFLPRDFKKSGGFKKSMQMARDNNFYCQNYCGCVYSLR